MRLDHLLSKEEEVKVVLLLSYQILPVAMRLGATPVPIPNTMVKTQAADGTALETMWESRWLPDSKRNKQKRFCFIYIQIYPDNSSEMDMHDVHYESVFE